jgi:hypothetical protein
MDNITVDSPYLKKGEKDQVSFILYTSINIRHYVQSNLKTEETYSRYALLRV